MVITVNGNEVVLDQLISVEAFLRQRHLNPLHVMVEVNGDMLERMLFSGYVLKDGDVVEVLHFVGGGRF